MSASNVRYSGQMESSYYVEEESCIADETAESYIDFEQQQCHAPSFQPSTMSDQGKAVYGIAVYPQPPTKQRAQPQVFCCELCGISCVGREQYADHLNGHNHKKTEVSQAYYCDLCGISCVGSQQYADHLNGKKHKKTEISQAYYCDLCGIICVGSQQYADHLNGKKHKKTEISQALYCKEDVSFAVNPLCSERCDVFCSSAKTFAAHVDLHTMIGRTAPTVTMPQASHNSADTDASFPSSSSASPSPASALALTAGEKPEAEIMSVPPTAVASDAAAEKVGSDKTAAYASDIVGDEFIEEVRNEKGLVVIYHCKLCECSLANPNARRVHLTGRRHRIQYKKKIDHIVGVDVGRRVTTIDDWYMIDKHMELYPPKEDMAEIHRAILALEHALKLISDFIAAEDAPSKKTNPVETSEATAVQSSVGPEKTAEKMTTDELCQDADIEMMETTATEAADRGAARPIKGAMRVGLLSKGLLLPWDRLAEHFVVLCSEIPTRSLLQRIVEHLRAQLGIVSPWKKFNVETRFEKAGFFVTIEKPAVSFAVSLTSMLVDEDHKQVDPPPSVPSDQLSPGHCLSALSLLRHTRWFQVHLRATKEGAVVAHVLRDFCRRETTWTPLTEWAQMLLVEKGISAAGIGIGPGEALRSFFACISSGILLRGGHGLVDPCKKVLTDVTAYLTPQQCEDITASAQQFMRLLVFHQLHKILCVAPFKGSEFKRRRDWDDKPEGADDKQLKWRRM